MGKLKPYNNFTHEKKTFYFRIWFYQFMKKNKTALIASHILTLFFFFTFLILRQLTALTQVMFNYDVTLGRNTQCYITDVIHEWYWCYIELNMVLMPLNDKLTLFNDKIFHLLIIFYEVNKENVLLIWKKNHFQYFFCLFKRGNNMAKNFAPKYRRN